MKRVIIIDSCCEGACSALKIDRSSLRPIGLGLNVAEVSDDIDDDTICGTDGVCLDLNMTVEVEGQPMDVHGGGIPAPSRVTLRSRLDPVEIAAKPAGPVGTGEGVLVGVVDTGIVANEWLDGGYLSAPDDFEKVAPYDQVLEVGHGTFAAGLILQQAPAAGVWVERVLDPGGNGLASEVAKAAETLAHRGVDVLNLSLGASASNEAAQKVMRKMVDEIRRINPKIVIVAAAGNRKRKDDRPEDLKPRQPFWPAALPWGVVAVGAVDRPDSDQLAEWSNGGPWLDVAAPGTDLLSTYINRKIQPSGATEPIEYEGWAVWSGTSFATAVVSGAIAALMTGPEGMITAADAVHRLREGWFCTGWTKEQKDDLVPSVPVIRLRTWDDHEPARKETYKRREDARRKQEEADREPIAAAD